MGKLANFFKSVWKTCGSFAKEVVAGLPGNILGDMLSDILQHVATAYYEKKKRNAAVAGLVEELTQEGAADRLFDILADIANECESEVTDDPVKRIEALCRDLMEHMRGRHCGTAEAMDGFLAPKSKTYNGLGDEEWECVQDFFFRLRNVLLEEEFRSLNNESRALYHCIEALYDPRKFAKRLAEELLSSGGAQTADIARVRQKYAYAYIKHECPECHASGAHVHYDAAKGALTCAACGGKYTLTLEQSWKDALSKEHFDATLAAMAEGLGKKIDTATKTLVDKVEQTAAETQGVVHEEGQKTRIIVNESTDLLRQYIGETVCPEKIAKLIAEQMAGTFGVDFARMPAAPAKHAVAPPEPKPLSDCKFIYTALHVENPQEYVDSLRQGYVNVRMPAGQESALFAALQKHKDEDPRILQRYAARLAVGKGCEADPEAAVALLTPLAEDGFLPAMYTLGYCYENGCGVSQNRIKATKWYFMAAEQGYATAQFTLGVCYELGRGVWRDYAKAVEWYRKAAEQGYADAQCSLGVCYHNCIGVPRDYNRAIAWYCKAVEQGNARAQNNLGVCYARGLGVIQNKEKAIEWYRKAAAQGYVTAQFNLGYCYENGQGVPQDYTKAAEWYTKAAEQGHESAQGALQRLKA